MSKLLPVILSGGFGSRLWPASRAKRPKQFLPLIGNETMVQATARRVDSLPGSSAECIVVCNEDHRFSVGEQIQAIGHEPRIIVEPEGRNTAPAVALAALEANPDDLLMVMPSDHLIQNLDAFTAAVAAGIPAAEQGNLVTFGIVPTAPETGYGYIRARANGDQPVAVEEFVEKPNLEIARAYVESGEYFWNSGMFLFRASAFLAELEALAPAIHTACRSAMDGNPGDDFVRPNRDAFLASPSDSIDYAVMEKSANAMMVPLDAGWSDVGCWAALYAVAEKDADGNTLLGDAIAVECSGTYLQSESRLVTAVGLRDVVVVETKDAVLVADRERSQEVKGLVDELKARDREEVSLGRQVFRPWGSYDSIDTEDGFQVKRLIVKPGAVLSLQKHAHRAEHWVCVKGKARITLNGDEFDLRPNESTYIGIGDIHRIANPYAEPVHIVEVQCGDYLGEDDIVRLEDNYGREGTNT